MRLGKCSGYTRANEARDFSLGKGQEDGIRHPARLLQAECIEAAQRLARVLNSLAHGLALGEAQFVRRAGADDVELWLQTAHYSSAGTEIFCCDSIEIGSSGFSAAMARMSSVIFMEQYLGPHMLQKWALLKVSCGRVSSCMRRAVSGSSDWRNCSFQSKAKRARLRASSRWRAAGTMASQIGGVGGDFVGDDALLHVVEFGQAEMFFRRDVAEHGGAVPAGQGGADGAGDVVVAGGDVGNERAENVERRFVAELGFLAHVHFDLVHRNVAGAFDHDLGALLTAAASEFAEHFQFRKLRGVAGVGDGAGAQAIAEAPGDIVLAHDVAQVVEVGVERVGLAVGHHPFGDQAAAAADDAGDAAHGEMQMLEHDAAVDGHVVDALLGLMLDHVEEVLRLHFLDVAAELFEHLINRHGADGDGRGIDNGLTNGVDVFAGGKIHDGVGAEVDRCVEFFQFFLTVAGDGGVADVGVDFGFGGDADAHRFETLLQVHLVRGNDQAAAGNFAANEFGRRGSRDWRRTPFRG